MRWAGSSERSTFGAVNRARSQDLRAALGGRRRVVAWALPTVVTLALVAMGSSGCIGHTDDATDITASSARLTAHGKTDAAAHVYFKWGPTTSLTNRTAGKNYPAGLEGTHSESIGGLSASKTYYFQACASDDDGTRCAQIHDFKTLSAAGEAIVLAAGDIGDDDSAIDPADGSHGQDETGAVIAAANPHKVLTLGDNAYLDGSLAQYQRNFDPWWGGPHTNHGAPSGFGDRLRPALGNHETANSGTGSYDYFNGSGLRFGPAGERGKGYYAHDLGSWRLLALNTRAGGVPEQAQLDWLAQQVAQNPKRCLLAYFHHPRFTSRDDPGHTDNPSIAPVWSRLWSSGAPSKRADLILNAHNHHYERYARQDLNGNTSGSGMRQIIVGTGGGNLADFHTLDPQSQVRHIQFGVVKLRLKMDRAVIEFLNTNGNSIDTPVEEPCH